MSLMPSSSGLDILRFSLFFLVLIFFARLAGLDRKLAIVCFCFGAYQGATSISRNILETGALGTFLEWFSEIFQWTYPTLLVIIALLLPLVTVLVCLFKQLAKEHRAHTPDDQLEESGNSKGRSILNGQVAGYSEGLRANTTSSSENKGPFTPLHFAIVAFLACTFGGLAFLSAMSICTPDTPRVPGALHIIGAILIRLFYGHLLLALGVFIIALMLLGVAFVTVSIRNSIPRRRTGDEEIAVVERRNLGGDDRHSHVRLPSHPLKDSNTILPQSGGQFSLKDTKEGAA